MGERMIEVGLFVKSKQGRDNGNVYIVKSVQNKKVCLVDGNFKTIEKPKVKNIKHIESLDEICEKLAKKFNENINVYNAEVYSAIKKFKNQ